MIFVAGVGRCGTSEVAHALMDLGVNMGHRHHIGDQFNKRGYFEDRDFQELNMMYVVLGLDKNPKGEQLKLWKERFDILVAKRSEPWGLKDPGIADFPELLDHYMKLNPDVILCVRNKEDNIKSFTNYMVKRMQDLSRSKAEHIYEVRTKNIAEALKGKEYLTIDCYDINKENKIKTWSMTK